MPKTPPPAKRKDTLTVKERAQQDRFLARALSNQAVTDAHLACMDPSQGHQWTMTNDFHVVPASTEGRRLTHVARDFQCDVCTKVKREKYVQVKRAGVERLERHGSLDYSRPEGYTIPGIPRGVKPAEIVRAERYRRSLEKAVGATRGQRATAER